MKMKMKIQFLASLFIIVCSLNGVAYAESTIEGLTIGKNIGLIHPNYSTADYDFSTGPSPQTDPSYHFGVRNEFYIGVDDSNYNPLGINADYVFNVSDLSDTTLDTDYLIVCDKPSQICPLHGFLWSDAIGWIVADGDIIRTDGFAGSELDFPNEDYPRVGYDGLFRGFMWSEKAGWIQLSDNTVSASTLVSRYTSGQEQTPTEWGVWMFTDECESFLTSSTCVADGRDEICHWNAGLSECDDNGDAFGRYLHGNAWSEKLGWIRFDDDPIDSTIPLGTTTTWIPDVSDPIVRANDNVWFANSNSSGAISWPEFAVDPQSGIEESESTFTVTRDSDAMFNNCSSLIAVDQYENGKSVDLLLSGDLEDSGPGILTTVAAGFCKYSITGTVTNGAGLTTPVGPITFFVRAGEFDPDSSTVTTPVDNSAIADGDDYIEYVFSPRDLAGNPIVPVEVDVTGTPATRANWMRDVNSHFNFTSLFHFDTINNNVSGSIPVRINDAGVSTGGTIYDDTNGTITFPKGTDYTSPITLQYPVQVSGFAPTVLCAGTEVCLNTFILNGITLDVDDAEMPAITDPDRTLNTITPASPNSYEIDDTTALSGLYPFADPLDNTFDFTPALTTSSDVFDTQAISLETPLTVTFTAHNESVSATLTDVSFDSLLDLNNQITDGDLYGEEVLDIHQIAMAGDTDGKTGRSDPVASTSINTCYELTTSSVLNNTIFHTSSGNSHSPNYSFYLNTTTPSSVTSDGSYLVDGAYYLSQAELQAVPLIYDNVYIDRTDQISFPDLAPGGDNSISFNLTASQVLGEPFENDVEFSMDQYLGYHIVETPSTFFFQYAIYKAGTLIDGVQVKNPGVNTRSDVGMDVYSGSANDFNVVPNASAGKLKELMRANAASLSRDIKACDADITISDNIVASDCVRIDNASKTIVAVYEGLNPTDVLTLDTAGDTFSLPDYKYTIIVKGANVMIRDNIVHSSDNASFGLIVLTDANGNGGNVFIHPDPTNITGLLYAEGSLLSSSDGSTLYYGTAANANDLKNQLFWQGAIMSRNTIGGGPNKVIPTGINCSDWSITDPNSCAQAFDLDYIRRFVPFQITGQPGEGYSPENTYFSGDGSCSAAQVCTNGSLAVSDPNLTTISLTNGHIDIDGSESVDSFFIEKINRPTPPGFSVSGGLTQYTEIRN